jgi:hypothetical protein
MVEKSGEKISTHHPQHPQVWLEAATSDGPNRNPIYCLLIASIQELMEGCTVSTLDTSYVDPSYSS